MRTRRVFLILAGLTLVATAVPAVAAPQPAPGLVPDEVPDRVPVLSQPVARGEVIRRPALPRAVAPKTIDGQIGDWAGTPARIGGSSRLDAGEHIYSDYLFDDFGADDGTDAERLAVIDPLRETEPRLDRLDAFQQAAGDQFGADPPVGANDHYGDADVGDLADISEVRWAAHGNDLALLVRTTTLTEQAAIGVLVLADTDGAQGEPRDVGFGTGLVTERFDAAVLLTADAGVVRDLASGAVTSIDPAVVNPSGWTNALEAAVPGELVGADGVLRVGVAAGVWDGEALTVANVAYRPEEPVTIYNDRLQALALHAGSIDGFGMAVAINDLRSGASDDVALGPGYHERQFISGENISTEAGEHGILQPYGLYVPISYDPTAPTPVTFWLHYRGGKTHSGAAWTPRLVHQLGEEQGNVVVTPRARGTSTWYVSRAHQDFFEVFADLHETVNVDPRRRYLSGYSMGGYGTYLLGLLYPDLFAAGYSTAGAVTQGLWNGAGPDDATCGPACFVEANDGDANAQLTYRVLENARHFPIVIHHGSNDELVPITGVQRMAARLAELGYRYDMTMFAGYEHYTQAIMDEWADGAAYLNTFTAPENPRRVTYKIVPAMIRALNTVRAGETTFAFNPDGAWWVDDLVVRDADPEDPSGYGLIDATSRAVPDGEHLPLPRAGVMSPLGHSTPFVRHGLDWLDLGTASPLANELHVYQEGLAAATIDGDLAGLDPHAPLSVEITGDAGPFTLTVVFADAPAMVFSVGQTPG